MYSWAKKLLRIIDEEEKEQEAPKTLKDEFREDRENIGEWFSTHRQISRQERAARLAQPFQVTPKDFKMVSSFGSGEDDTSFQTPAKSPFVLSRQILPEKLFDWYVSQSFIGYQACSFIAQNWLIDRGCNMKGRDAVRNGFKIIFDDGNNMPPEVIEKIEKLNRKFQLKKRLAQADKFKNVFGISHVLFMVDSDDPEYYEKPFNQDGISQGSYKGMVHIDPYWITPLLTTDAVEEPGSPGFYDPTYWVVSGKKYHRSHFAILRGPEVSDVLKPGYLYGGLPLTQLALERVYAAERTANEAPQLALSKRLVIHYLEDLDKAIANQGKFEEALTALSEWRDNFGVYASSINDRIEQQDTSLSDLDVTIMTQYQIVAGIFGVPSTKLMGTSPKGFQATGEHEIKTYHEELESLRENDITPIVDKHHVCLMRSHIAPMMPDKTPRQVEIVWNPLSVMSEREQAETQEIKARTHKTYQETGAIDGYDIRDAVIADESSGFSGIEAVERPEEIEELPDLEFMAQSEELQPTEPPTPPAETTEEKDQTIMPIDGPEITSSYKPPYSTHDPKEPGERPQTAAGDVIKKQGGRWVVMSKEGRKLGTYGTRRQALSRLRQIEEHKGE